MDGSGMADMDTRHEVFVHLRLPQLFVNPPHAFHEAVSIKRTRTRRVTFHPACAWRLSMVADRCMNRRETDHITRNVALSNLESFHIARTVLPSNLSSAPTSSSAGSPRADSPAFEVISSGFVMRSTDNPRHPAACLDLRPGGGDLARSTWRAAITLPLNTAS